LVKIFSGYYSGQLLEHYSKRTIFAVTAFFPLFLIFLAFAIGERPRAAGAPTVSARKTITSVWASLKQRKIWGPMLFVFLLMLAPSSQASFFFFLTNELHMQPNFMGTLQLVEGCSSLIGLAVYNVCLKRYNYKSLLKVTIVLTVIAGATPLILILRLNQKMGISDKWFCIGDTALLNAIGQIAIMPLLCLGAETCRKDVEATLYSCLMSTLNIGALFSTYLGGLLTWALGITSHDFHRLWILCLICNLSTLCVLPFLMLVPDKAEDDSATPAERQPILGDARRVSQSKKSANSVSEGVVENRRSSASTVVEEGRDYKHSVSSRDRSGSGSSSRSGTAATIAILPDVRVSSAPQPIPGAVAPGSLDDTPTLYRTTTITYSSLPTVPLSPEGVVTHSPVVPSSVSASVSSASPPIDAPAAGSVSSTATTMPPSSVDSRVEPA